MATLNGFMDFAKRFHQSDWEVAMHFAAVLNVLLRSSLPPTMELDGFLALCLPLTEGVAEVAGATGTAPVCLLDNLLHGDNPTRVKKTAVELCSNLYRREFPSG